MSTFNLLDEFADYGGEYDVVETKKFSKANLKAIKNAEVVEKEQEWGISTSICLHMTNGKKKYIPLSKFSELEVGDTVDPASITITYLKREGEDKMIKKGDGEILDIDEE